MSNALMKVLPSTSASLNFFSLLSLKLPHSILCNTGLARARRKLLERQVVDDDLQDARTIIKCFEKESSHCKNRT
jgi:hypothetical protein